MVMHLMDQRGAVGAVSHNSDRRRLTGGRLIPQYCGRLDERSHSLR